jgi:Putative metallopeptidase
MFRQFLVLLLALFLAINAKANTVTYEPPLNSSLQETFKAWQEHRLLESVQTQVLAEFNLDKVLSLSIRNCGKPNAYYDPRKKEVVMCWELLSDIVNASLPRFGSDKTTLITAITGLFSFVLYHEIGHAVFNLLPTSTFGREEDIADQFATLMVIRDHLRKNHANSNVVILAIFDFWRSKQSGYLSNHELSGVHSLGVQRAHNVACWAIGSDPSSRYRHLPQMINFPTDRVAGCVSESRRASDAFARLANESKSRR